LTLIPTSLYTSGRLIKCELGLAKGKREHEKRASIKEKDIKRDMEQELNPKLRE
jgi:SsrA-binding protein